MSIFYHEESPIPSKRCKFLAACLKDVFSNCHTFGNRVSTSIPDEDLPPSDFDDEQEVVVSAIRSRAMEKLRKKPNNLTDSFSWIYSPITRELYITPKGVEQKEDDGGEEFVSVKSCFSCSCCSSAASRDAFLSVKTSFSRTPSLNGLEFIDFQRRSIIQELCHCEGWPFGLCRKAVLLPPLPKSPSESWSWSKSTKIIRI
ncbi:uncharacterized protein LOC107420939 [Ziziphus jujuba]|uniref:Uncharacterized protein LOC107420939 n=1 Tax=Ziziphus jujuba TaxID=326968 RepID=A0A6P4AI90_ZIZJJ|nr:uncharacterized protein LOC107420939 [Ziziphus jujuba]